MCIRDSISDNPVFETLKNPSGFSYPTPGSVVTLGGEKREVPKIAPRLGQNSEEVLSDILAMGSGEIASLIDHGIVKA